MDLENALNNVPKKFRERIIKYYLQIKRRYSQAIYDGEYDSSGLSTGKFCEVILRFLQEQLTGTYIPFNEHISLFNKETEKLEKVDRKMGNDSTRILIPRAINFLYTIRNKRSIGHVGGDIEANAIDSATSVRIADWIICELIRIYHKLSLEEAQDIIDALSSRNLPDIWEVNGKKRILRTDLSYKQKVLVLAYSEPQNGVLFENMFNWVEYSDASMFRRTILAPLHNEKLIEYDKELNSIHISPTGIKEVEEKILKLI